MYDMVVLTSKVLVVRAEPRAVQVRSLTRSDTTGGLRVLSVRRIIRICIALAAVGGGGYARLYRRVVGSLPALS